MASKSKNIATWVVMTVFILMNTFNVEAAPSLVNIGVGTDGRIVVINARLMDGFTNSISQAVESGVPISFTFEIELRQQNPMWADTLVSSNVIKHTVQYDSLKKVYRFSENGKGIKRKVITRNKENYHKLMLTLNNIPIASSRRLDNNEKYYVRVKADLDTDRLWFPFNHLFFFLPFNDFEAAWAESSPLSISPDTANIKDDFRGDTQFQEKNKTKGINNVVRSFNK